ncbi:MAG: LamG-like jellyroll fold domain-containing protein [Chthoniobacterales bacterium]
MKNVSLPFLCLLVAILGTPINPAFAATSNIFYFEDNANPTQPTDSSANSQNLFYRGKTHQTTKQSRFGHHSMEILQNDLQQKGLDSPPADLPAELHKLSLVVWVRPASINSFTILRKRVPGEYIPNSFAFGYAARGYKCLMLNFFYNGSNHNTRSSKIFTLMSEEWIHLAVTFDQGKVAFYLNGLPFGGVNESSPAGTTIQTTPGQNVYQSFFDIEDGSYVDDFGIFFDRALNPEEIEKIYTTGLQDYLKNPATP